ncbi:HET-domain-containing protein [Ophiobolus disseminans]|uniref:HET-domain-containing protein n=1 Tax=Ophiobolus disseminans TaxID=1469910 RepID=A0A6A7A1I2_9PLEO|nr:HET-domain-containing protein [Ophiobolus disseminans]
MRLINTKSRKFMEYVGDNVPPYAILSHTWEEGEEVTYQEFLARSNLHKKGWEKIWKACELAEEHEISLVWVDTCGIDKSSSAELSEAINSMYQWYKKSQICFAFLSDWSESDDTIESMRHCRWFTRGWTLQELIAPATVLFFDKYYTLRGSKESLVDSLADVTAVDRRLLRGLNSLADFSVAQKMSWAANRQTTRKEDQAYSLLGIFDINLPLLYGEGEKAFRRLQEEIIRTTVDLSIFVAPKPALCCIQILQHPTLSTRIYRYPLQLLLYLITMRCPFLSRACTACANLGDTS